MRLPGLYSAIRYQWVTAALVCCGTLVAAHSVRSSFLNHFSADYEATVATMVSRYVPAQVAWRLLSSETPPAPQMIVAHLGESPFLRRLPSEEPTDIATRSTQQLRVRRLLAQRSELTLAVASARAALQRIHEEEQGNTKAQPVAPTSPAVVPTVAPTREEASLQRQISSQQNQLTALRSIDTEAHPDVIEAREALAAIRQHLREVQSGVRASQALPAQAPKIDETSPPPGSDGLAEASQQLALLLRTQASVDKQIRALKTAPAISSTATMGLINSALPSTNARRRTPSELAEAPAIRLTPSAEYGAYLCTSIAIALSLALLSAVLREWSQDHVSEADVPSMGEAAPVPFFEVVPRMRQS